jgi:hypothetical protein
MCQDISGKCPKYSFAVWVTGSMSTTGSSNQPVTLWHRLLQTPQHTRFCSRVHLILKQI